MTVLIPYVMSEKELSTSVLAGINFIRSCMGLKAVMFLPKGIPGNWDLCPIAIALDEGSLYHIESRDYAIFFYPSMPKSLSESIGFVFSGLTCTTNKETGFSVFSAPLAFSEFVKRYDDEEFHDLIRDGYQYVGLSLS